MKSKQWWLYILVLEKGKWYVGITSQLPEARFREHRLGKRAAYWTMKHKPISIELIEDLGIVSKEHAESYENNITRKLMEERGLNNVRGGDLTSVENYTKRFGWIWKKYDWDNISGMLIITAIAVSLCIYLAIRR